MSLKPPERRSIASQLVLLSTLASTLVVGCSLAAFYWLMVRHTFEEDNAALTDKTGALTDSIRRTGPSKALQSELQSIRVGEQSPYWVRVIAPGGTVLAERTGMAERLPVAVFPPAQTPADTAVQPVDYRTGANLFSLVTIGAAANGQRYLLQVAQDRSADADFNRQAGVLFLATLALSIVASGLIARSITKRGLRPLVQISQAVRRIGPTRLDERVAPVGWPTELQPLAEAFDHMLGRLEESFIRLSQFSADLAHELRTPIANILGEAQVCLTRERTAEEYRSVIESTVAECERLSNIADNLLFLARAESAREQIQRTHFDGRAAIEKIASFYRTIAEERNIIIDCEGSGEVHADPLLLNRAVSNLVDNAMRFTPDEGRVCISLSTRDHAAEVSVSDNGCGISPEHIARVFDRFYRADPARSAAGSGLGLALVKSIVELHGGTVVIDSRVNKGTTVTLRFPNP